MKAIYIFNPHAMEEMKLIDRVRQELSSHLEELEIVDFESAKERFKIRATPALILIRDDFQGEELLCEDEETGQLRVTLELYKAIEEEENNIFNLETHRIDNIVNGKVTEKIGEKEQILEDALTLLTNGGII